MFVHQEKRTGFRILDKDISLLYIPILFKDDI